MWSEKSNPDGNRDAAWCRERTEVWRQGKYELHKLVAV